MSPTREGMKRMRQAREYWGDTPRHATPQLMTERKARAVCPDCLKYIVECRCGGGE